MVAPVVNLAVVPLVAPAMAVGAVALVAMAAVIRDRLWRGRWPAHNGFIIGTLGVTAAMAT